MWISKGSWSLYKNPLPPLWNGQYKKKVLWVLLPIVFMNCPVYELAMIYTTFAIILLFGGNILRMKSLPLVMY
ncbi:hypothetical protein SDC9_133440 [bioreactor metagenome]|uniref:Uncharacterized protein n=1 Tax=bioreactor metagenome TaxID=1076179 RepID=A0A645DAN1_9ZZZZ